MGFVPQCTQMGQAGAMGVSSKTNRLPRRSQRMVGSASELKFPKFGVKFDALPVITVAGADGQVDGSVAD